MWNLLTNSASLCSKHCLTVKLQERTRHEADGNMYLTLPYGPSGDVGTRRDRKYRFPATLYRYYGCANAGARVGRGRRRLVCGKASIASRDEVVLRTLSSAFRLCFCVTTRPGRLTDLQYYTRGSASGDLELLFLSLGRGIAVGGALGPGGSFVCRHGDLYGS